VFYTEAPRLYQTHTVPEIARLTGVPEDIVRDVLRDQGVIGPKAAQQLLSEGMSAVQIAARWGVSPKSVSGLASNAVPHKVYREKLYGRCDVCGKEIRGQNAIVPVGEQDGEDVLECWCKACVERYGVRVARWEAELHYTSRLAED
jgi:hypothetical protein